MSLNKKYYQSHHSTLQYIRNTEYSKLLMPHFSAYKTKQEVPGAITKERFARINVLNRPLVSQPRPEGKIRMVERYAFVLKSKRVIVKGESVMAKGRNLKLQIIPRKRSIWKLIIWKLISIKLSVSLSPQKTFVYL